MKKSNKSVFRGAATALITPFSDGKLDYDSLERLIEYQISEGIDALLVCGTTGESATLTDKEKREIIRFSIDRVEGRVPLIAGTGSNNTASAVKLSKYASDAGADAVLCVTPYYNKASDDGLVLHYGAISKAVNIPVILYNVPSRTGMNIPLSLYGKITDIDNVCGVKEASGSLAYFTEIQAKYGERTDIYSGNDDLLLPALSVGSAGIFSVISNLVPKIISDICRFYVGGNAEEAKKAYFEIFPLIKALSAEINPIPIKALLAARGLCREEYRLPLSPLSEEKYSALLQIAKPYLN